MTDILIYESGNGGEISLKNGDIETTDGLLNMPYLSHFGGNIEASTEGNEEAGEERFDYWGNTFLDSKSQMNSDLERELNNVSISSKGRAVLEETAKKDIEFLAGLGEIESVVSIVGSNKISITDKINKNTVAVIWDSTNDELIEEKIL